MGHLREIWRVWCSAQYGTAAFSIFVRIIPPWRLCLPARYHAAIPAAVNSKGSILPPTNASGPFDPKTPLAIPFVTRPSSTVTTVNPTTRIAHLFARPLHHPRMAPQHIATTIPTFCSRFAHAPSDAPISPPITRYAHGRVSQGRNRLARSSKLLQFYVRYTFAPHTRLVVLLARKPLQLCSCIQHKIAVIIAPTNQSVRHSD